MSDWKTRQSLLIRVKDKHDESSWEEFDSLYRPYIYTVIRRMGPEHEDAQELMQSILLAVWKRIPDFDYQPSSGRFRGWISTITANAVRNFLKRKSVETAKYKEYPNTHLFPYKPYEEIQEIARAEWEVYVSNMAWDKIEDKLAPKVKEVYQRLYKGEKPISICEEMGIEQNTIYVYKKRVLKLLSSEVKRLDEEYG